MSEHDPRPEERYREEPTERVGDLQPIAIPDLRKRDPWYKAALRWVIILGAIGLVLGGYLAFERWNQKREVKRLIIDQYSRQSNSTIASLTIERIGDGKYTGILVTSDGTTLDVFAESDGRWIKWVTQIPIETRRKEVREDFERNNQPVKTVELHLDEKKMYSGKVVLQNGDEFDLRESQDSRGNFQSHYEYSRTTVEKWVHAQAESVHHDKASSIVLNREGKETYSGSCKGESGIEYAIRIEPHPERKETIRTYLKPTPDHVERWVTHQLQKTNDVKLKGLTLKKRPQGDYAGQAVLESGVVWDVRAGTPPTWAKTAKAGLFDWQAVIAPESYGVWVRVVLEERYRVGFGPVKLSLRDNGTSDGTATDDDGQRYQVKVWRDKFSDEDAALGVWPELGGKLMWEAVPWK